MRKSKSWKALIAGFAAAACVVGTADGARAASCGNADNAGSAQINDAILIIRAQGEVALRATLCGGAGYNDCADTNKNGNVDIADVVGLLREINHLPQCIPLCQGVGTTLAGCPGPANIPLSITSNLFIPASCDARLNGLTFVEPGATLTIQAGATVKGNFIAPPSTPATLVVKRGGRLNAVGTSASPIVFTSAKAPGTRGSEDWGGIALLGQAQVNVPPNGVTSLEGLPPTQDTVCGGTANNDNSGCLRFVRSEFAGRDISPNNELNNVVFCGVGRGTTVDHVQGHLGADDCIEWFGGTVNSKFMIASACGDDGIDTQLGTQRGVQYILIAQRTGNIEGDSHGFEMDNIDPALSANQDVEPCSNVHYCNVTAIGLKEQGSGATTNQIGVRSRRGNTITLANSIIKAFSNGADGGGLSIQDPATSGHMCHAICVGGSNPGATCRQASDCTGGGTCTFQNARAQTASPFVCAHPQTGVIENSLFFNNGATGNAHGFNVSACDTPGECACTSTEYFNYIDANENVVGAAVDPMNIGGGTFPPTNLIPAGGSLAATNPAADCTLIDGSFESAPYMGAFEPGGTDWTAGWSAYPLN